MACTLQVAWDERLTDYHFGPGHPMAPVRVELTMRLAREFGLWSQPGVTEAAPAPATDADLELVHDAQYISAVEAVSRWAEHPDARDGLEGTRLRVAQMFGLGTEDNPVFPGMHEAWALVTGATLAAARAAWSGSPGHGASIAGGMHHAMEHGCDTHRLDPLAHLELSIDAQRAAHAAIHALAHELAGGRWLLMGGGGYDLVQVVPRTWTHLIAEAAGQPIDPATQTPARWREYVAWRTGLAAPEQMTDGASAQFVPFESGYDPADPVDRAIMATRREVFPLHGLMPLV